MYGLVTDLAAPAQWQPEELKTVVDGLTEEYPGKSREELEHAVEYCRGAVRRRQGVDALQRFASGLLHSVDLHRAATRPRR